MRILISIVLIFFYLLTAQSKADIIKKIEIKNNNRISKQTIITYGNIELNKDYDLNGINEIFKNLYKTNFFESLKIDILDDTLVIDVKENKIIQTVLVKGIKSKNLTNSILENLFSKDKSPFLISKVKEDVDRIKISLNTAGYYFAEVNSNISDNNNGTIDLIFEIDLGEKAVISKIEFIGDKKIKDRTLRNVIISEEDRFWKFISKKKFLNKSLVARDQRLLKNFYLDKGFYDVDISSSTVDFFNDNTFKLTYRINAGNKYIVNSTNLILPSEYKEENFKKVIKILKKLENENYSFSKISKVVDEIDKISLSREYEFINAEVNETKISNNKLNIEFKIKESEQFYVERINILGNNITHENVIRNTLEIDEGDPFNELLNAKSINNMKA